MAKKASKKGAGHAAKKGAKKTAKTPKGSGPQIGLPQDPPADPGNGGLCVAADDPICFWNNELLVAAFEDSRRLPPQTQEQGGPTRTSRAAAIVHAAIHDAVNAVLPVYEPYLVRERVLVADADDAAAFARAAVGGAAYSTLAWLYPSRTVHLNGRLAAYFGGSVPFGDPGLTFGIAVGGAYQLDRRDDGSAPWDADPLNAIDLLDRDCTRETCSDPPYFQKDTPGEWRSDPLDVGGDGQRQNPVSPGWGAVRPFTFASGPSLRVVPFPYPASDDYEDAFEAVRQDGDFRSSTRSGRSDGFFWSYDDRLGTNIRLYNRNAWEILRDNPVAAAAPGTPLHVRARLFALLNLAMADAGIVVWDSKYAYNHWRPIEGIRRADELDAIYGSSLARDANWRPVGRPQNHPMNGPLRPNTSPPFPAYTSGHSGFGEAFFATMRSFYGSERSFTLSTEERDVYEDVPGDVPIPTATPALISPKSFSNFEAASLANGASRILLGVHWTFDDALGRRSGAKVAANVFRNFLRPLSTT